MPINAVSFSTPQYVLMDVNRRIGPKIQPLTSGQVCSPIYGFTNKLLYDRFRLNTPQQLIPYPLVKRYLTQLIEESGEKLLLVVFDAVGPDDPVLYAATTAAVLEAQSNGEKQIASSHQLTIDPGTKTYRVEAIG